MVDFSEALKARIQGMSSDELSAAEVRRMSRESQDDLLVLDSLWEPTVGDKGVTAVKPMALRLDEAAAGGCDSLKISQGTSFHETILLTPSVYRLIVGGRDNESGHAGALAERFTINPGLAGHDRVSVDREALCEILEQERPLDIERARRLFDRERQTPATMRLRPDKRLALFVERWNADVVNARLDAAVAKVSSRTILLMAGRDNVALWVRKEDLIDGSSRVLDPDFAPAILRPAAGAQRRNPAIAGTAVRPSECYLRNSHGAGPERMLLLDLSRLRRILCAMTHEDQQHSMLSTLQNLIGRSHEIERERHDRMRLARSLPKLTYSNSSQPLTVQTA